MAKPTEVDTYIPPTEDGIKCAIKHGVKAKFAKLGFDIFDSDCGMLVRRLYYCYEEEKSKKTIPSREACARQAETLGLCKIIPVGKLPKYMPKNLKKYIWIDTPENKKKLKSYFSYLADETR